MTPQLAVVGDPVAHSVSPALHRAALRSHELSDWRYLRVRVPRGSLAARWEELQGRFVGLNVTAPHKLEAAELVGTLTARARACGSVNTVTFNSGESLGDSTDGAGFLAALSDVAERAPRRALVLGAGGAARAVAVALRELAAEVTLAARDRRRAQRVADELQLGQVAIGMEPEELAAASSGADLLVNATPVGAGGTDSPLPSEVRLERSTLVFDLLYSPLVTPLQRQAAASGCRVVGGLGMLVEQAALSFEAWTSLPAPRESMRRAGARALRRGGA